MSDEAQDKPAKRAASKPSRAPSARSRQTDKAKAAAATAGIGKAARVSVPVVPETAASAGALSRRASAIRLGLLTTTLALLVGNLILSTDAPAPASEPAPTIVSMTDMIGLGGAADATGPADPLAPHVRQSLEQDHRLAALALDIQQSHESLARLWEDARSLAESVGTLASGIDHLKSDVSTARIDAAVAVARVEERLQEVKVAAVAEPIELGDPALRELTRLGYPNLADAPQIANAAEPVQPATTGGLPEAAPQASVKVAFNKPTLARSAKPIKGWQIHSVRDDLALVVSEDAHYEVKAGELLPGAGIVRGIKKRGEQWVVLTSKGIITEAR
jgi:hypothetical protein